MNDSESAYLTSEAKARLKIDEMLVAGFIRRRWAIIALMLSASFFVSSALQT